MYKCSLDIAIYSDNNFIFNTLNKIEPFENFEYTIAKHEKISKNTIMNSDIIILDIPYRTEALNDLYSFKKENSLIVVCSENNIITSFNSNDYSIIHDIWVKPFNKDLLIFYFNKLQRYLKQSSDLEITKKYLDTTIDTLPDLIWYKDIKGAHLKVNQSFCNTVGKTKKDVEGRGHYYIWDIERDEYEKGEYVCMETDEIVLKEKKSFLFDENVKCNNEMRHFKTYKSPIFNENNVPIGTVGIARDVTGLENIQIELETLIQNMPFAILIISKEGYIINANNRYLNLFSIEKSNVIGEKLDTLRKKSLNMKKWKLRETERGKFLYGNNKILKIQKENLVDVFGQITGYIHLYIDITFEDNYESKLLKAANTDYLTKLNNRRGLNKFVENHPYWDKTGLMIIDLDNFKIINDKYGHVEGDQILVNFSNILLELFPSNNVFRLGGDEFLVTFIDIVEHHIIEEYAQTIIDKFKSEISTSTRQELSVSIGIAINISKDYDYNNLFKKADAALYQAKDLGKSQYSFGNEDK